MGSQVPPEAHTMNATCYFVFACFASKENVGLVDQAATPSTCDDDGRVGGGFGVERGGKTYSDVSEETKSEVGEGWQ